LKSRARASDKRQVAGERTLDESGSELAQSGSGADQNSSGSAAGA